MGNEHNGNDITNKTSMTKESIAKLCKKNDLYMTPHLNDVLYLHYQGYRKIENLDAYINVKCLWLECNGFTEICGLDGLTQLRCLFLQNNFIRRIENLQCCINLDTLNLSHNNIKCVDNCDTSILPCLTSLNLANNFLSSLDSLQALADCKTVSVLDLSNNRIDDILIVKTLAQMPELRVLILTGNPVVNAIPSYRKTLIVECKSLTYLDSRPVFARDRACAEAWKRGGYEEEKRELARWNDAEQRRIQDSIHATLRLMQKRSSNNSDDSPIGVVQANATSQSMANEPAETTAADDDNGRHHHRNTDGTDKPVDTVKTMESNAMSATDDLQKQMSDESGDGNNAPLHNDTIPGSDDKQLNGRHEPCEPPSEYRCDDNSVMSSQGLQTSGGCTDDQPLNGTNGGAADETRTDAANVGQVAPCEPSNGLALDSKLAKKSTITFFCQNLDQLRDDFRDTDACSHDPISTECN